MDCADSVNIRAIGPVNIMAKKRKATSPLSSSPPSKDTKNLYSQRKQDVQELRQRLTDIQRRLDYLEQENDSLQQRTRQACLIFTGSAIPAPSQEEETGKLLKELLFKHMRFDLDLSQVKRAFRLRNQNILVEFSSVVSGSDRDSIYRQKTRLQGSGLFISESLTPRRQGMLQDLLQLKRAKQIWTVFTQSGNIFVRKTHNASPIKIPDMSAVHRLKEEVSGQSVHSSIQRTLSAPPPVPGSVTVPPLNTPLPAALSPPPPLVQAAPSGPSGGDPIQPLHTGVAVTFPPRTDTAPPDSRLDAPVRPLAVTSGVVPASADLSPVRQSDSCRSGADGGSAPPAASTDGRGKPATAVNKAGRPPSCKLRVAVGDRSRIISIDNEGDVVETVTDLKRAASRKPEKYFKCVDEFWRQYSQCVEEVVTDADERGPHAMKVAEAVRQVKASIDQRFQLLK